jgi:hypothetical protein
MSGQKLPNAWMWTYDGEIRGLRINIDRGLLQWHDSVECHCADDGSAAEQTLTEYVTRGVPAGLGEVPADVLAEVNASVAALLAPQGA